MRVLVTGGAGYVGSILCEHLLDAGCHVTVVDRLMYGEQNLFHLCANPRFQFIFGDARDPEAVKEPIEQADVLIPLAALVGAPACDRDPQGACSTNFESIQLLDRLRSRDQLVIFPNTNSGYGSRSGDDFCTEDTPLEPISVYGRTKVQAELFLLEQPNVVTLRLATVFGMSPRMRWDLLVNHFVYSAYTDGYLVVFEKDFRRNYIHIRDVADCFLYCIENAGKMIGLPYNVGLDTANISKSELATKIREYVPDFYIHYAEIGSDPDKRNYVVSSQRLRQAGFEARRTLDAGIVELLKGYSMLGRRRSQNV